MMNKYGSSKLQDSVFDLSNKLAFIPAELYKFLVQAQSVYCDDDNEVNFSVQNINIAVAYQDISEYPATGMAAILEKMMSNLKCLISQILL